MPYKNGPNGTHRLYSSRTGRYVKEQYNFEVPKKKKTSQERKEERIQNLERRAQKAKDPFVKDVFNALMEKYHGCVIMINDCIYDKRIKQPREFDIVTKKQIIEIKSGNARHKTNQFIAQARVAEDCNKSHVVFLPQANKKTIADYRNKGINVVSSINDILKGEK